MATSDFFVRFGSNAKSFSTALKRDLADAHSEIDRLASRLKEIEDTRRRLGMGGGTAPGAQQPRTPQMSPQDRQRAEENARRRANEGRKWDDLPDTEGGSKDTPPPSLRGVDRAASGLGDVTEQMMRNIGAAGEAVSGLSGSLTTLNDAVTRMARSVSSRAGALERDPGTRKDYYDPKTGRRASADTPGAVPVEPKPRGGPAPEQRPSIAQVTDVEIGEAAFNRVAAAIDRNVTATRDVETAVNRLARRLNQVMRRGIPGRGDGEGGPPRPPAGGPPARPGAAPAQAAAVVAAAADASKQDTEAKKRLTKEERQALREERKSLQAEAQNLVREQAGLIGEIERAKADTGKVPEDLARRAVALGDRLSTVMEGMARTEAGRTRAERRAENRAAAEAKRREPVPERTPAEYERIQRIRSMLAAPGSPAFMEQAARRGGPEAITKPELRAIANAFTEQGYPTRVKGSKQELADAIAESFRRYEASGRQTKEDLRLGRQPDIVHGPTRALLGDLLEVGRRTESQLAAQDTINRNLRGGGGLTDETYKGRVVRGSPFGGDRDAAVDAAEATRQQYWDALNEASKRRATSLVRDPNFDPYQRELDVGVEGRGEEARAARVALRELRQTTSTIDSLGKQAIALDEEMRSAQAAMGRAANGLANVADGDRDAQRAFQDEHRKAERAYTRASREFNSLADRTAKAGVDVRDFLTPEYAAGLLRREGTFEGVAAARPGATTFDYSPEERAAMGSRQRFELAQSQAATAALETRDAYRAAHAGLDDALFSVRNLHNVSDKELRQLAQQGVFRKELPGIRKAPASQGGLQFEDPSRDPASIADFRTARGRLAAAIRRRGLMEAEGRTDEEIREANREIDTRAHRVLNEYEKLFGWAPRMQRLIGREPEAEWLRRADVERTERREARHGRGWEEPAAPAAADVLAQREQRKAELEQRIPETEQKLADVNNRLAAARERVKADEDRLLDTVPGLRYAREQQTEAAREERRATKDAGSVARRLTRAREGEESLLSQEQRLRREAVEQLRRNPTGPVGDMWRRVLAQPMPSQVLEAQAGYPTQRKQRAIEQQQAARELEREVMESAGLDPNRPRPELGGVERTRRQVGKYEAEVPKHFRSGDEEIDRLSSEARELKSQLKDMTTGLNRVNGEIEKARAETAEARDAERVRAGLSADENAEMERLLQAREDIKRERGYAPTRQAATQARDAAILAERRVPAARGRITYLENQGAPQETIAAAREALRAREQEANTARLAADDIERANNTWRGLHEQMDALAQRGRDSAAQLGDQVEGTQQAVARQADTVGQQAETASRVSAEAAANDRRRAVQAKEDLKQRLGYTPTRARVRELEEAAEAARRRVPAARGRITRLEGAGAPEQEIAAAREALAAREREAVATAQTADTARQAREEFKQLGAQIKATDDAVGQQTEASKQAAEASRQAEVADTERRRAVEAKEDLKRRLGYTPTKATTREFEEAAEAAARRVPAARGRVTRLERAGAAEEEVAAAREALRAREQEAAAASRTADTARQAREEFERLGTQVKATGDASRRASETAARAGAAVPPGGPTVPPPPGGPTGAAGAPPPEPPDRGILNSILAAINRVNATLQGGIRVTGVDGAVRVVGGGGAAVAAVSGAEPRPGTGTGAGTGTDGGTGTSSSRKQYRVADERADWLQNMKRLDQTFADLHDSGQHAAAAQHLASRGLMTLGEAQQFYRSELGMTSREFKDFKNQMRDAKESRVLQRSLTAAEKRAAREATAPDTEADDAAARREAASSRDQARSAMQLEAAHNLTTDAINRKVDALRSSVRAGADANDITQRQVDILADLNAQARAQGIQTVRPVQQAAQSLFQSAGLRAPMSEIQDLQRTVRAMDPGGVVDAAAADTAGEGLFGERSLFSQAMFGNRGFWGRMLSTTGAFIVRNFAAELVFGLGYAMAQVIQQAIQTESTFVRVSDAIEATGSTIGGLRTELGSISSAYGVALNDVYETAASLVGVFGGDTELIAGATEITSQLQMISGGALSAAEAVGALTSIYSAFASELPAGEEGMRKIADVLTVVQEQLGVNIEVTAEGVGRLSGLAQAMGLSFAQTAVYVGQIAKLTNQTGAAAGEQMSRILAAMSQGPAMAALQGALPGTGIQAQLSARDFGGALETLMMHWDDLTEAQQTNIAISVAGQRQAASFRAMMASSEKVINTVARAEDAHGNALERSERMAKTLTGVIARLGTNFQNFFHELVRTGILNAFAVTVYFLNQGFEKLNFLLSKMNDIIDDIPFLRHIADWTIGLLGLIGFVKLLTGSLRGLGASLRSTRFAQNFRASPTAGAAAVPLAPRLLTDRHVARIAAMAPGAGETPTRAPTFAARQWDRLAVGITRAGTGLTNFAGNLQTSATTIRDAAAERGVASRSISRTIGLREMGATAAGATGGLMTRFGTAFSNQLRGMGAAATEGASRLSRFGSGIAAVGTRAMSSNSAMAALILTISALFSEMQDDKQTAEDFKSAWKMSFGKGRGKTPDEVSAEEYVGPFSELVKKREKEYDDTVKGFWEDTKTAFSFTAGLFKEPWTADYWKNPLDSNMADLVKNGFRVPEEEFDRAEGRLDDAVQRFNDNLQFRVSNLANKGAGIVLKTGDNLLPGRTGAQVGAGAALPIPGVNAVFGAAQLLGGMSGQQTVTGDLKSIDEAQAKAYADIARRARDIKQSSQSKEQKESALADVEVIRKNLAATFRAQRLLVQGLNTLNQFTGPQLESIAQLTQTFLGWGGGPGKEFERVTAKMIEGVGLPPGNDMTPILEKMSKSGLEESTRLKLNRKALRLAVESDQSLLETLMDPNSKQFGDTEQLAVVTQRLLGNMSAYANSVDQAIQAFVSEGQALAEYAASAGRYPAARRALTQAVRNVRQQMREDPNLTRSERVGYINEMSQLRQTAVETRIAEETEPEARAGARTRNAVEDARLTRKTAETTLRRLQAAHRERGATGATQEQINQARQEYWDAVHAETDAEQAQRISAMQRRAARQLGALAQAQAQEKIAWQQVADARNNFGRGSAEHNQAMQAAIQAGQTTRQAVMDQRISLMTLQSVHELGALGRAQADEKIAWQQFADAKELYEVGSQEYNQALTTAIQASQTTRQALFDQRIALMQVDAARILNEADRAQSEETIAWRQVAFARRIYGAGSAEHSAAMIAAIQASQTTQQALDAEAAAARETELTRIPPGDAVAIANKQYSNALAAQQDALKFGVTSVQYQQATQAVIQSQWAVVEAHDAIAQANASLNAAIATAAGDTVGAAAASLRGSRLALADALRRSGGAESAEVIAAREAYVNAQRAFWDAQMEAVDARVDLAVANAEYHGFSLRAVRLQLRAARTRLRGLLRRSGGEENVETTRTRAEIRRLEGQERDTLLQNSLETIDFNLEMGRITEGAAISALREILRTHDLTKQQRRDIQLRIKGMTDSMSEDLWNFGDITMPTPYQMRRFIRQRRDRLRRDTENEERRNREGENRRPGRRRRLNRDAEAAQGALQRAGQQMRPFAEDVQQLTRALVRARRQLRNALDDDVRRAGQGSPQLRRARRELREARDNAGGRQTRELLRARGELREARADRGRDNGPAVVHHHRTIVNNDIRINGADIGRVRQIIKETVGQAGRVRTTQTRRR